MVANNARSRLSSARFAKRIELCCGLILQDASDRGRLGGTTFQVLREALLAAAAGNVLIAANAHAAAGSAVAQVHQPPQICCQIPEPVCTYAPGVMSSEPNRGRHNISTCWFRFLQQVSFGALLALTAAVVLRWITLEVQRRSSSN